MLPLAIAGGALLGQGISSAFLADAQRDAARESSKILRQALGDQLASQEQTYSDVSGMYQPWQQGGLEAWQEYQGYDPTTTMPEFSYTKGVQDFLDPSMAYQQEQGRRQLEASAAASGSLGSGAFAQELQNQAQQLAQADWANAQQRMMQDKNFAYQNFMNRFQNTQANNQARMQQLQNISGTGMNLLGQQAGLRTNLGAQQAENIGQLGNVNAQQAGINQMTSGSGLAGNIIGGLTNPQTLGGLMQLAGLRTNLGAQQAENIGQLGNVNAQQAGG